VAEIIILIMDLCGRISDQKADQHYSQPHLELHIFIVIIYYHGITERNLKWHGHSLY